MDHPVALTITLRDGEVAHLSGDEGCLTLAPNVGLFSEKAGTLALIRTDVGWAPVVNGEIGWGDEHPGHGIDSIRNVIEVLWYG